MVLISSVLSVKNNRRWPVMESEPRAVPYRGAQKKARFSSEI